MVGGANDSGLRRRPSPFALTLWLMVIQPVLVKAPLLLGLLKSDPRLIWSGLGSAARHGLGGGPTLDPNIAFTSHALGTLSARLFWHGQPLWWNPHEGVGSPLAGEMQSAALFPPTWLMILPQGQLFEHILFQIIAGTATFLLLRRLGTGVLACWFGGTAFAFNGAFAWLANAVINPVCFLPVMLLGIELSRDGRAARSMSGGVLIAAGLAGSLYAGFPEVAYLNGLLVAVWTLLRLGQQWRAGHGALGFATRVAVFGVAGCLLAAPVTLAFADFLRVAYVGVHNGAHAADALSPKFAAMMLIPYLPGAIGHGDLAFWGSVGGFVGFALATLALAGSFGRSELPLRLLLAGWVVVNIASIFGIEPFAGLVRLVPGVAVVAVYRYVDASVLMAMAMLAALAIDDMIGDPRLIGRVRGSLLAVGVVTLVLVVIAAAFGIYPRTAVEALLTIGQLGCITLFGVAVLMRCIKPAWRVPAIAVAASAEMAVLFAAPLISYPISRGLDLGGVAFLQRNLGLQRFVSLGPIGAPGTIAANYGSYFGIAQLNHNDLPVAQSWVDYIHRHLDPNADPVFLNPDTDEFLRRLPAYGATGTRFVTTPADHPLPTLKQVYGDAAMLIYELPAVTPYVAAAGCTIRASGPTDLAARCDRASRLDRLELFMPGWSATVNDHAVAVERVGEIFQSVLLPAGRSEVRFDFQPPHGRLGVALAGLGALLLAVGLVVGGGIGRRRTPVREEGKKA